MKKLIAIFFMLLLTPLSFAEAGKNCDRSAKLTEKLDLQEDQVDAVQQIMKQQHEKRRELFQTNRDAMRKQMEALHDETRNQLSSVLNPEQMTKFEELDVQRVEKMKQKREKRKEYFKKTSQIIDNKSNDSI
jgi:Spy/CpxP family protein refolding chaperone